MSMGESLWLSESNEGDSGGGPLVCTLGCGLCLRGEVVLRSVSPPANSTRCPAAALITAGFVIISLSFRLYFSFSLRAASRSLLRPRIMALCLSTNLHSWLFCCDWECFSFSRCFMTASGLPAVLIRLAISGDSCASWELALLEEPCFDEMADMAVSMEEFRGNPLAISVEFEAIVAIMADPPTFDGPAAGFDLTGSETLRLSFGRFGKSSLRNI